jgi:hypothetical protein
MKDDFWGKKDDVSMARSLRLAVIQNQYAVGNLEKQEAKELLAGPLDPNDPTTVYDDSDCLVPLWGFIELVQNDQDMTPEQKLYWLKFKESHQ